MSVNDPPEPVVAAPATAPPPGDLPPVEPPSARFIVQLFIIPFLVVVVLVCFLMLVYVFFGKIATGGNDATDLVRTIRSGNENRRWRAAQELASLIHNDPKLTRDPALLGELTLLLDEELNLPKGKLQPELAQYLALALGAFETLEAHPSGGRTVRPAATLVRALDEGYPAEVRVAAATSLSRLADRLGGRLDDPSVVGALADAGGSADPNVRQQAVYALGYFDEPASREALRRAVTEDVERLVRYNAAVALARLDAQDGLPVLREMLSQPDLEAVFASELRENPEEARRRIEAIELEAILTLKEAVAAGKTAVASSLRPDLVKLAASGPRPVQVEVKDLLKTLPASP